jgi:hypothetical protein
MNYQTVETGLDLGTRFLTAETAYFLGLLLADERENVNGKMYWSAPIRHNPKQVSLEDMERHLKLVKAIASVIHKSDMTQLTDFLKNQGVNLQKYNAGKTGIVTLFEEIKSGFSIEEFVHDITEPLLSSNLDIQRAFIVGVYDGRGSDDGSSLIAVDFEKDVILGIVEQCLNNLGIEPNVNNGSHSRLRDNPNSTPRKNQIRIKRIDYLSTIGYISIERFNKSFANLQKRKSYANKYSAYETNSPLPGLKLIRDLEETQKRLF